MKAYTEQEQKAIAENLSPEDRVKFWEWIEGMNRVKFFEEFFNITKPKQPFPKP